MLKDNDFIVFSDDWGRTPSSTQHLFKALAPGNRIFWFNTIGMRLPQLQRYDIKRSIEKVISWFKKEHTAADASSFYVFSPFMLPFFSPKFIRKLNKKILLSYVRGVEKKFKINAPVLFSTIPTVCDLFGELGEKKKVYFCVDEFSRWPGVNQKALKSMEQSLLRKVDFLFCASSELLELKKKEGFDGVLLTHGVDRKHFVGGGGVPENIRKIPSPIIGFIGSLDHRIDFELVAELCKKHANCSFAFGGRDVSLPRMLRRLPNFFYIGNVAYEVLPKYLKSFDICILPYKNDEKNIYLTPLKLKEVILVGRPVISTDMPNVNKYSKFIKIARSKEEFTALIGRALSEPSSVTKGRISNSKLFIEETWLEKAKIFSRIIQG